ncbi:hypothetical protein JOS77_28855 [Chromobacterium haemolyticum]|nr:hypothetical protein JOS77_28855 [Chromobacterium haemolyticum]
MTPIEAINAIAAHRLDIHFHRPERGKISVWSEEQRERVYRCCTSNLTNGPNCAVRWKCGLRDMGRP